MRLLLVPAIRRGQGSGHLRRCLALARSWPGEAAVLLENCRARSGREAQELLAPVAGGEPLPWILSDLDPREPWDLVLLDGFRTPAGELTRFDGLPVVGLDEGGPARRFLPYLVDTPLGWGRAHPPNLASSAFLELPPGRASWKQPFGRILISFGGEDPADLSGRLLKALLRRGLFRAGQLTVVQGPWFRRNRWPGGIEVLRNPRLSTVLADYDLLFTSFGLTALEAQAAGVPLIIFNPTRRHRRLARNAGLPEIGVRRPRLGRLRKLLDDPAAFQRLLQAGVPGVASAGARPEEEGLGRLAPAQLLPSLLPAGRACCPVCGHSANPAVARFPRRSYFRCRRCRVLYLADFGLPAADYGPSYFFEEYRRQYGRTYLEDFPAIQEAGRQRLRILAPLLPQEAGRDAPPRLLDVGCAYGPFLQAARENGLKAEGLEVAGEAVRHVREKLGLACRQGDFLQVQLPPGGYDAVTLWYVLEHFRNTAAALEQANRLLRPGGVLALSTPSASGISALRSLRRFLAASPADHFTIWTPALAGPLLRRFGFRLKRLRVTGHHPERFPGRLPPRLARACSRLLGLGDTFEAYAVKIGEPG
jgi:2-polyprenyl-3-methyl-5-hydroxy-6-metoxy-1,4-benzoquinol methylase